MKKLVLIRHAKSSHPYGVKDFDRDLSDDGIEAARSVAALAAEHFSGSPLIWYSPSRRTAATATAFAELYRDTFVNSQPVKQLYTFSMYDLERVIRKAPDEVDTLIVFGHNEGITEFVNTFGDIYIDNVPTSGLVPITFNINSWKDISNGETGRCLFPKLLPS